MDKNLFSELRDTLAFSILLHVVISCCRFLKSNLLIIGITIVFSGVLFSRPHRTYFTKQEVKSFNRLHYQHKKLTELRFIYIKMEILHQSANKYEIDTKFICALIKHESNWDSFAVSSAGARGLGQIMPYHTSNPALLFRDGYNIRKCVWYLRLCMKDSNNDKALAIQKYNAGLRFVQEKYENYKYVMRILNSIDKSTRIEQGLVKMKKKKEFEIADGLNQHIL